MTAQDTLNKKQIVIRILIIIVQLTATFFVGLAMIDEPIRVIYQGF